MTELEMFVHLTAFTCSPFKYVKNICIPNVVLDYGRHECDAIILTPARWATEVEIKCSLADLKRDVNKKHQHISNQIKFLWFALAPDIPEESYQYIPERAGILQGWQNEYKQTYFKKIREPEKNKDAVKWTQGEYERFLFKAYERMYKYLFDLNDCRRTLKTIRQEKPKA